ncbi:L-rhamnose-binding lectin CSL3-like isoform X2 [Oculina patagonica]
MFWRLLAFCLLAVLFGGAEGYYWRTRRCERSGVMRLSCSHGYIYIASASYGRSPSGDHLCGGGGNRNCHASSSMSVVEHECEGQRSCTLHPENSAFGDPCVGTHKYLEVFYKCVTSSSRGTLLRICENHSDSISCPWGQRINILSANYGRTTGRHICPDPAINTNCRGWGSLSTVRNECQGEGYCKLEATNYVFGDPCQGTRKYLEVRYKCV